MSGAVIGGIEIQMLADLARLRQDMTDAKGIVGKAAGELQGIANTAQKALGALGVGLSVGAFAGWIKGSIDAADTLNDLSKTTGITVEKLSGLRMAAAQSGSDLGSVASAINKLSVNMGKDSEKFAALGITAKQPIEAFKQLADVFVSVKDPQLRAALGAEALGKKWEGAAPALLEGGARLGELIERGERFGGVTQDMADQADTFNDRLEELKSVSGAVATGIASSILPTLTAIASAFRDAGVASGESKKETGLFASALTVALKTVSVLALNVGFVLKGVGGEIVTWGKQIKAFATGNIAEGIKIGQEWTEKAALMRAEVDRQSAAILGAGKQMAANSSATADNTKKTEATTEAVRKFVGANKESTTAQEKLTKAGQDYLLKLNEEYGAVMKSVSLGRDLAEGEKAIAKLEADMAAGKIKLTAAELESAKAKWAEIDAIKEQRKQQEEHLKLLVSVAQHSAKLTGEQDKNTESMRAGNVALAEENERLRLGDSAWGQREIAVMLSKATDLEWQASMEGGNFALEEQARLLRERAKLTKDGTIVREANAARDAWQKTADQIGQGLTDSLFRAFESGKGFFRTLWDGIKNLFKTTVLQLAIKPVQTAITGVVGGMLGGFGGPAAAAGGAGGLGSLASLGGTVSGFAGDVFGSMIGAGTSGAFGSAAAMLGTAMPYIGAALAAMKLLGGKATPHMGSVVGIDAAGSMSTMYGDSSQILNNYSGETDAALRALGGVSVGTLNSLSTAFGGAGGFGSVLKFAADGKDASIGDFALSQGGKDLVNWGATQGDYSKYTSNREQAFTAYAADVAEATRQALSALDLPEWARSEITKLGAGASLADITRVADELIARKSAMDSPAADAVVEPAFEPIGRNEMLEALQALRERVEAVTAAVQALQASSEASGVAIAANTGKTSQLLTAWDDGDAMATREVAA
jgi:hypothetical protein